MYGLLQICQFAGMVVPTLESHRKAIKIHCCVFFRLRYCIECLLMVLDGLVKVGRRTNPVKAGSIAFTNAVEERGSLWMAWRCYFKRLFQISNRGIQIEYFFELFVSTIKAIIQRVQNGGSIRRLNGYTFQRLLCEANRLFQIGRVVEFQISEPHGFCEQLLTKCQIKTI